MGQVPNNWLMVDVETIIKDYQSGFASGEKNVAKGVKHLRMNNIGINGQLDLQLLRTVPHGLANEQHFLKDGDVLVCTTNSAKLVGKCALFDLDGEYVFSNHLTRLRVRPGLIDSAYLQSCLWLRWKLQGYEERCKHWVNQSTLPKEELLALDIPLPLLNEQHRIVAKLDQLLPKVQMCQERIEKVSKILKRFRQSVLAAACSGRLTADWREENVQADEWPIIFLGQVLQNLDQGWSPKCEIESSSSNDVWGVIKTTAVQALEFMEEENKRLPQNLKPRPHLELKAGDLLITRAGPRVRAGVCCFVRSVRPRLMICDKVYRFRTKENEIMPQFLALALNALSMVEYIDTLKTGISDNGVNLTQNKFRDLKIHLPALPEQQEIVRRVESLFNLADQIEARYQKAKASIDKLTQSILAKAFRGELVPQNPNDEPASVLLERIRAEKGNNANNR